MTTTFKRKSHGNSYGHFSSSTRMEVKEMKIKAGHLFADSPFFLFQDYVQQKNVSTPVLKQLITPFSV